MDQKLQNKLHEPIIPHHSPLVGIEESVETNRRQTTWTFSHFFNNLF